MWKRNSAKRSLTLATNYCLPVCVIVCCSQKVVSHPKKIPRCIGIREKCNLKRMKWTWTWMNEGQRAFRPMRLVLQWNEPFGNHMHVRSKNESKIHFSLFKQTELNALNQFNRFNSWFCTFIFLSFSSFFTALLFFTHSLWLISTKNIIFKWLGKEQNKRENVRFEYRVDEF